MDHAPDPADVASVADLIEQLVHLRAWAGDPPYRTLARRVGQLLRPPQKVASSTIADMFRPTRRRLNLDLVVAVVRALGCDDAVTARWRSAYLQALTPTRSSAVPGLLRQLPPDLATFTGRRDDVTRLINDAGLATATAPVVTTIEGMPGVGKTQLAIHVAHQLVAAGHYGDGQLYVNLQGFRHDGPPAEPASVLGGFLRALGVPPERIPADLDARAALFRSTIHDRRMLLVLDNAAETDQVRDLIPAEPAVFVIVTSRRSLAGLDSARTHRLGVLNDQEAVELLAAIAGAQRIAADPDSASAVVAACGRLPLAIALVAARLSSRPAWQLADLRRHLDRDGLAAINTGSRDLRTIFDLSYRDLPRLSKRLYRLLALAPGADITAAAAAALAATTQIDAEAALESLLDEHLLQQETAGRYQFHDLIREYATECLGRDEAAESQTAAFGQLLNWYLHSAGAAVRTINPNRREAIDADTPKNIHPETFHSYEQARDWLEHELANLMAVQRRAYEAGRYDSAARLPLVMWELFAYSGHYHQGIAACHVGLRAARELRETSLEARLRSSLATSLMNAGQLDEATEHLLAAAALHRDLQYARGEATARFNLGVIYTHLRQFEAAEAEFAQCLSLHQSVGYELGEGKARLGLAILAFETGDYERSRQLNVLALDGFDKAGDVANKALALRYLASVDLEIGQLDTAETTVRAAIDICRTVGHPRLEGHALDTLGQIQVRQGNVAAATATYQTALTTLGELDPETTQRITIQLADLS